MVEVTRIASSHDLELPDTPSEDGLAVNEAGSWVHDKLAVVTKYDPAFGTACQKWGEWYYVDGLAGSGVNRIAEEGGRLIWGSPVFCAACPASIHAVSGSRKGSRPARSPQG